MSDWFRTGITGEAYDRRFADLEARGDDLHGEARFVAGLEPSSVLDAGCGTGRVAVELARSGIDVTGVDLDPELLATARAKAPELDWRHADLADVALGRAYDVVLLAGNVLLFVASGSEPRVIANLAAHLTSDGALVAGFQLLPGRFTVARYDELCAAAGLEPVERWATWDRAPWTDAADYGVSVHRRP